MVKTGRWLGQAWDWLVEDLGIFILIGLLACLLTSFSLFLATGPVAAGLALAALRKAREGRVEVDDFFEGFRYFGPAFIAAFIIVVLTAVGLVFVIIPGLVILSMYAFSFHFLVDRDRDFWRALEASREMVAADYFGFTVLVTLLVLANGIGLAFLGIGVVVTVPLTALALTAAYVDLTG